MRSGGLSVRKVIDSDRDWILTITREEWGADFVAVHEQVFYPHQLPGFVAENGEGEKAGLVTFISAGDHLEIITLNSIKKGAGVGSALIKAIEKEARSQGVPRILVTTTNDNQRAIDFYQQRGFQLAAVREGAADRARRIKPSIPLSAEDELDYVLLLG